MKKVKFDVQGMTCGSCSSHVERAVNKLNGIKSVNVNLLSNNMIVEYDEQKIDNNEIIQAVAQAGYNASLSEKKEKKNNKKDKNKENIKSMKKRFIISLCFLIPLMYVSMHHMLYEWFKLPVPEFIKNIFHGTENSINYSFTQFILLLPIIYVNRNYFIIGFKRLFKGTPNMDSLIAIGASAAIIYGIFAIYMIGYGLGHNKLEIVDRYMMDIYFESAGTILTLITLGKYLETKSKGKTSDAISKLINLTPKTAIVIKDGKEIETDLDKIIIGDIIEIRPGSSIPVDGVVVEGSSSIDQASITGESIPVEKNIGDTLISGTINKNGYLKMKATKVGEDTTLSQIIKLVEEASNSKAPISKIADKVSSIFVPTVIIIAIITIIIWILAGQSFEFALTMGIAVLVISCPCALGLATPVAIMVGTGKGAENGILIKSAESLEMLHSINTVILDKTGTITEGKPVVTDVVTSMEQKDFLIIAGSLERKSEHPLAEAITNKAKKEKIEFIEIQEFQSTSGRGIQGKINGQKYFAGNIAFMYENKININEFKSSSDKLASKGKTVLYFASENKLLGIIAVADVIKETSYVAIKEMKKRGIETIMVTGDNHVVAETIAKEVGINKVVSEVLPQDKEKEVEKQQLKGRKVAFVGDGINDSPALIKADVGIAIGSGTDIAIESADIVLMKNNLEDVVTALGLGKAVIRNIKTNLFWAFFYNCIGIPIACGILYPSLGLKLNPMIGAAAMSLSSVCVVTNALRLRKYKINFKEENKKMTEYIKNVSIEGMQCNHCKMSVEKALNEIEGVINVDVNLENKNAIIKSEKEIEDTVINSKIEDAGFKVIDIK